MATAEELVNEINRLKSQAKAMSTNQNFLNAAYQYAKYNAGGGILTPDNFYLAA